MKVYLAGGMHTDWQDKVKEACEFPVAWFDPRLHQLESPQAYTEWDLGAIFACDVVFAYMEEDNPGGQGLLFEMGYARALRKYIIFVDNVPENQSRYWDMARASSNLITPSLDEGIMFLRMYYLKSPDFFEEK